MTRFEKLSISLRYYLIGKGYNNALKAWHFAEPFHDGFRKDGITKDWQHQLEVANLVRLMPLFPDPELCLTVALLHDTPEDKDVPFEEIKNLFGTEVAKHVRTLSKKFRGVSVPTAVYYDQIALEHVTAIVKGCDRDINVGTMVGVFTKQKLFAYVDESKTVVIPMLKKARRLFPEYETTFEILKHSISQKLTLIEKIIELNE
jgi:hypothetical protein